MTSPHLTHTIDRAVLSALQVIGADATVVDPVLPSLPLGSVRVAEVDVTIPVLGRPVMVTVQRIVSTLPPAGSATRYH